MAPFLYMNALLLSAYHTDSHRHWAEGLINHVSDVDWTLLSLPGRHFPWRIRGNPITWKQSEHAELSREYDLIVATSMVDLSTLIGLYPNLGTAHKVLYFHENQFEYPLSGEQKRRAEPLMVSLYASLAADRVLFNSRYNQRTFVNGARRFLKRMPERVDLSLVDDIHRKSSVLPVPLEVTETIGGQALKRDPALILWNHRWEYDKNPEDFFAALRILKANKVEFRLAVVGQRFRHQPDIFTAAEVEFADQIRFWGFQSWSDYQQLLQTAGIVVSTAWHEFQGLSVMEATQAGCVPLVPDRLCYPEYYPSACLYDGTPEALARKLRTWLSECDTIPCVPDMHRLEWSAQLADYRLSLKLDA